MKRDLADEIAVALPHDEQSAVGALDLVKRVSKSTGYPIREVQRVLRHMIDIGTVSIAPTLRIYLTIEGRHEV